MYTRAYTSKVFNEIPNLKYKQGVYDRENNIEPEAFFWSRIFTTRITKPNALVREPSVWDLMKRIERVKCRHK